MYVSFQQEPFSKNTNLTFYYVLFKSEMRPRGRQSQSLKTNDPYSECSAIKRQAEAPYD